ncbi:MAG TPA: helix-turn-helix domain-containing protein [Solirubrobacteraceae bacterium]
MSSVEYAEYAPTPQLRDLVACGWTLTCQDPLPDHRVLPDGCIDIVLTGGSDAFVAGPSTTAFDSPMPAGGFAAGIRFRPGAAPSVLGVAADELRDRIVPLGDVWSRPCRGEPADAREALALLHRELLARLPAARSPDRPVLAAAAILAADPTATVRSIARSTGLGERQLRRRFLDHVGYGPKRLARVLRLQRLLAGAPEPWAQRAIAAGYADQAHMTRECVALTGRPPTRLAGTAA